ncbi:hypothetical protein SDC9_105969 [bioreactor metagenome]|uniref:Uncharacterized protein n=1 Tax=bioreactor metagenome TaxID=1076179 RepID=A0A645B3J4_9ZZZZ
MPRGATIAPHGMDHRLAGLGAGRFCGRHRGWRRAHPGARPVRHLPRSPTRHLARHQQKRFGVGNGCGDLAIQSQGADALAGDAACSAGKRGGIISRRLGGHADFRGFSAQAAAVRADLPAALHPSQEGFGQAPHAAL